MGQTRGMTPRTIGRWLLGAFLVLAGFAHLTIARETFRAQVPDWLPFEGFVVLASGVVEIALGLSLVLLVRHRVLVGWIVAAFFVAVLPGNVNQLVTHSDAFGLDTDRARAIRLFFQPVLPARACRVGTVVHRRVEGPDRAQGASLGRQERSAAMSARRQSRSLLAGRHG